MKTYNHAFCLGFSVAGSTRQDGEDITTIQFVSALLKRITDLVDNNEMLEAVGAPMDTYEEE